MSASRRVSHISTLFFICIAGVVPAFSQADAKTALEPSYEAVLQVVIGSNELTPGSKLPKNLSSISGMLDDNYSFASYRLANTFIGRVANTGGIEYKSVSDIFGKTSEGDWPTFLDWNLSGLRSNVTADSASAFQVQQFRFGARVPIRTMRSVENGKASDVVNYESVGLVVNRLAIPENRPTMIGTISLPKTSGTVFLVLTVKPAVN